MKSNDEADLALRERNALFAATITEKERLIASQDKDIEKLRESNKQLELSLDKARTIQVESSDLTNEKRALIAEVKRNKQELRSLEQMKVWTNEQITSMRDKIESLSKEKCKLMLSIEENKAAQQSMLNDIKADELSHRYTNLHKKVKREEESLAKLNSQKAALTSEVQSLGENITTLIGERDSLREVIEEQQS